MLLFFKRSCSLPAPLLPSQGSLALGPAVQAAALRLLRRAVRSALHPGAPGLSRLNVNFVSALFFFWGRTAVKLDGEATAGLPCALPTQERLWAPNGSLCVCVLRVPFTLMCNPVWFGSLQGTPYGRGIVPH